MPTSYPKCNPTEMFGLLVLLDSHKGSEDVALLARDLDLEIDEIFPALEYSEVLGLVKVVDGRATFTDMGRKFVAASIRERKALLREQLKQTTLFKTLLRALENSPNHRLTDEELSQIFSFTTARADDAVQNIVNWGRYAGPFPVRFGGAQPDPPPASGVLEGRRRTVSSARGPVAACPEREEELRPAPGRVGAPRNRPGGRVGVERPRHLLAPPSLGT